MDDRGSLRHRQSRRDRKNRQRGTGSQKGRGRGEHLLHRDCQLGGLAAPRAPGAGRTAEGKRGGGGGGGATCGADGEAKTGRAGQ